VSFASSALVALVSSRATFCIAAGPGQLDGTRAEFVGGERIGAREPVAEVVGETGAVAHATVAATTPSSPP
jgi:hypothetical protein